LHSRAAADGFIQRLTATNPPAMRRVVPLEVTQLGEALLAESLSSVDRSMRDLLWQPGKTETSACALPETFRINGGHQHEPAP